jgi:hypothetical protein
MGQLPDEAAVRWGSAARRALIAVQTYAECVEIPAALMIRALDAVEAGMQGPFEPDAAGAAGGAADIVGMVATLEPADVAEMFGALLAITDRFAREMLPGHGRSVVQALRAEALTGANTGGQPRHRHEGPQ